MDDILLNCLNCTCVSFNLSIKIILHCISDWVLMKGFSYVKSPVGVNSWFACDITSGVHIYYLSSLCTRSSLSYVKSHRCVSILD